MKSFSDEYSSERRQRSTEQVARGGIPLDAEHRLRLLREKPGFFTSNLSVNEFVLTHQVGFRPLGQVMGSSIYHVGWQWSPIYTSCEMTTLNNAYCNTRRLALSRLQQEAQLLGAQGVVGVRITRCLTPWEDNLMEFTATGTAVAYEGAHSGSVPFLTDLTGQEFWSLLEGGYRPVGIVFGSCRWYQVASFAAQYWTTGVNLGYGSTYNIEIKDYTQAVYTARQFAMSRIYEEAAQFATEGIIGMAIDNSIETREVEVNEQKRIDVVVQFTAIGTAIVQIGDKQPPIYYTVPLDY